MKRERFRGFVSAARVWRFALRHQGRCWRVELLMSKPPPLLRACRRPAVTKTHTLSEHGREVTASHTPSRNALHVLRGCLPPPLERVLHKLASAPAAIAAIATSAAATKTLLISERLDERDDDVDVWDGSEKGGCVLRGRKV